MDGKLLLLLLVCVGAQEERCPDVGGGREGYTVKNGELLHHLYKIQDNATAAECYTECFNNSSCVIWMIWMSYDISLEEELLDDVPEAVMCILWGNKENSTATLEPIGGISHHVICMGEQCKEVSGYHFEDMDAPAVSHNVTDLEECISKCREDVECSDYNYIPHNNSVDFGSCFLHSDNIRLLKYTSGSVHWCHHENDTTIRTQAPTASTYVRETQGCVHDNKIYPSGIVKKGKIGYPGHDCWTWTCQGNTWMYQESECVYCDIEGVRYPPYAIAYTTATRSKIYPYPCLCYDTMCVPGANLYGQGDWEDVGRKCDKCHY